MPNVNALQKMGESYKTEIPKGASQKVKEVAQDLVEAHGPNVLLETSKCHFKTLDEVLKQKGFSRTDLEPDGQATSKTYVRKR